MSPDLLTALTLEAGEPPGDELSARVLDAALELSAASGTRNLTIDDVAARAQVGRMTIYRRFGDRGGLIQALVAREGRRCLAELDAASAPNAPIEDQLIAGFLTSLRLTREHPLLNRLARVEPESVLRSLRDDGVFAMGRLFLAERLRASQRAKVLSADVNADEVAEVVVRLMFSFVLLPESVLPLEDEERAAEVARRVFVPLLQTG
jgi:AcrR family transcriptional regulator